MQSNIAVGTNAITGTLLYVADYSSAFPSGLDSGNYIALHASSNDADSVSIEIIGGTSGERTLDADGLWVGRITSNTQQIKVRAYKDGAVANERTYNLNGLVLNAE